MFSCNREILKVSISLYIVAFAVFELLKFQLFVFRGSSFGQAYALTPAHAGVDAIFVFLMLGIYNYYYNKNKANSAKEEKNNLISHSRYFLYACRYVPLISFVVLGFKILEFLKNNNFGLLPVHVFALAPYFLALIIFPFYSYFSLQNSNVLLLKKLNPKYFRTAMLVMIFCWISAIVNFLDTFTFIFFTFSLYLSVRILTFVDKLLKNQTQ